MIEIIPHLFRNESSKIISVISKNFGIEHLEAAEDIVSDTFLLASETWGLKGLPENPSAWLYRVAINKAKDYCKRNQLFAKKVAAEIKRGACSSYEVHVDLTEQAISDSQLQMIFAICHPSIPKESQIGLSLRILGGFGIDEIAEAFLTNKETIKKRLGRAKAKLKEINLPMTFPTASEVDFRLDTVATTLYLLFNEGYYSNTKNGELRKDFCVEAMRLTYMLVEYSPTNKPYINALLALMCFQASRFDARTSRLGASILYRDQDTNLWNGELIVQGNFFLNKAAKGNVITKFHLEAAIAYWHTSKEDTQEKWESILQLYNQLLKIEYSPAAALNRTYAVYQIDGPIKAIEQAEKLSLAGNHLYHCLLGELYTSVDTDKAIHHLQLAINLTELNSNTLMIEKKLSELHLKTWVCG